MIVRMGLIALLVVSMTPTMASADHKVPKYFNINGIKIEGNKCTESAFKESFWSKGERGKRTRFQGNITRVCGTTRVKWDGLTVSINWIDDKGRSYTDCEQKPDRFECWVTLPNH